MPDEPKVEIRDPSGVLDRCDRLRGTLKLWAGVHQGPAVTIVVGHDPTRQGGFTLAVGDTSARFVRGDAGRAVMGWLDRHGKGAAAAAGDRVR